MSDNNHKDIFTNHIDKPIILHIKTGSDRKTERIEAGKSADLRNFRGKGKVCFIIEAPVVPSNSDKNVHGLRLCLPADVNPDSVEVLKVSDKEIKLIACFNAGFPSGPITVKNHIDPEVHHPEGDT